jgi:hypothetical protein
MEDSTTGEGTNPIEDSDWGLLQANTALIRYPRFRELHGEIRECQELSKIAGEPQCLSLEGTMGAGKSTLLKDYAAAFPRREADDGVIVPVLYLETPYPATPKGVAAAMLGALRDPAAGKGPLWAMNSRLTGFTRDCQVELVILDDIHHLIDRGTDNVLVDVSEWLKVLIKNTGIPFLIVGLDGTVTRILDLNPQLSRLFAAREKLEPFAWDEDSEKTIRDFSFFVQYAEEAIGMRLSAQPLRRDMLRRLHYATGGIVGNLMNLLRAAMLRARKQGRDELDLAMLTAAFEKRLAEHVKTNLDPFAEQLDTTFVPPEPKPRNEPDATGRRSRRKEKRGPTVGDVLKAH